MEDREFRTLVAKMRNAQKMYFRYRTTEYLNQSKALERQVDNAIRDFGKLNTEPELPFS